MKNEKEVIEHIKKRYTYDAATGEIRIPRSSPERNAVKVLLQMKQEGLTQKLLAF